MRETFIMAPKRPSARRSDLDALTLCDDWSTFDPAQPDQSQVPDENSRRAYPACRARPVSSNKTRTSPWTGRPTVGAVRRMERQASRTECTMAA
jgi:hypothetical protein